ncbi:polysaccharide pyruvyl transferase family protein [Vibrio breoganii]
MKILVVNKGYSDNLGDQAILRSMNNILKDIVNEDELIFEEYTSSVKKKIPIYTDELNLYKSSRVKQFLRALLPLRLIWLLKNFHRIRRAVNDQNLRLVIIGGGQLVLSNTYFPVAAFMWVGLSKYYRKKVIFSNVGVGTTFSLLESWLYKYALMQSNGVAVRDEKSGKIINEKYGISPIITGDIVFCDASIDIEDSDTSTVYLGITERNVYNTYNKNVSQYEYYSIWYDFLIANEVPLDNIVLFYTTQEDFLESINFKNYLENLDIIVEISQSNTLDSLENELKLASLVVSGRMHALILSKNIERNILCFPISKKLIEFERITKTNDDFNSYREFVKNSTVEYLESYLGKNKKC